MLHRSIAQCAVFLLFVSPVFAQDHSLSSQHPKHGGAWEETRLYFGLGPADDPAKGVSEADWKVFLDTVVTPRFPSGLSVEDVYGQWQDNPQSPVQRLRSKVIILDYAAKRANAYKVEEIRTAWKTRTGDLSVLRVTHPVDVSF